jgi:hypothetical protein
MDKNEKSAHNGNLSDTVRGVSNKLISDSTNTEGTTGTYGLTSFDSDGFTIGTSGSGP